MKRIVILASGSGTTFEYLVDHAAAAYAVVGLFCNRPMAGVMQKAHDRGIPSWLIDSDGQWQNVLTELKPDLIVLAGYLKLLPSEIAQNYRVINTHPALLPKFGGHGFYGDRVHRAVLAAGERETGVTVHWVDEAYDRGDIIAQVRVPIMPGDTTEKLAARVQAAEKPFLLTIVKQLVEAM